MCSREVGVIRLGRKHCHNDIAPGFADIGSWRLSAGRRKRREISQNNYQRLRIKPKKRRDLLHSMFLASFPSTLNHQQSTFFRQVTGHMSLVISNYRTREMDL